MTDIAYVRGLTSGPRPGLTAAKKALMDRVRGLDPETSNFLKNKEKLGNTESAWFMAAVLVAIGAVALGALAQSPLLFTVLAVAAAYSYSRSNEAFNQSMYITREHNDWRNRQRAQRKKK
ncbi:MAG: hypothetical protein AAB573_02745 [Patescibacteria group bacterium]